MMGCFLKLKENDVYAWKSIIIKKGANRTIWFTMVNMFPLLFHMCLLQLRSLEEPYYSISKALKLNQWKLSLMVNNITRYWLCPDTTKSNP